MVPTASLCHVSGSSVQQTETLPRANCSPRVNRVSEGCLMHRDARPPAPQIHCRMLSGKTAVDGGLAPDHRSEARLRIDPKVLVFVETTYTQLGKSITELLVHNRIK
uniref:Heparan sulfate-N-deacetylase N-terminal domain-containing protein n=1 Tax=Anopheles atroparvus TaxID=41427 RepID=A0A182ITW1_ANOAO